MKQELGRPGITWNGINYIIVTENMTEEEKEWFVKSKSVPVTQDGFSIIERLVDADTET